MSQHYLIHISDLRFISATIGPDAQFDNGRSIVQLFHKFQRGDLKPDSLEEPLNVVYFEEKLWSQNTRRLVALKLFQALHREQHIVVRCIINIIPLFEFQLLKTTRNEGLGIDYAQPNMFQVFERALPEANIGKLAKQPMHENLPLFDGDYCAYDKIQRICGLPGFANSIRPARSGDMVIDMSKLTLNAAGHDNISHSLSWQKQGFIQCPSSPQSVSSLRSNLSFIRDCRSPQFATVLCAVKKLRFTHNTINHYAQFGNEKSLYLLFHEFQKGLREPDDLDEPLEVIDTGDGKFWSLSNRRLVSLLMYQALHEDKDIHTRINLRHIRTLRGKELQKFKGSKTTKNDGFGIDWGNRSREKVEPTHRNMPIFDSNKCAHLKLTELFLSPDCPKRPAQIGELCWDLANLKLVKSSEDPDSHSLRWDVRA